MNYTPIFNDLKLIKPIKTSLKAKINCNKNIKAIIFDIYGTLIISDSGDIGQNNLKNKQALKAFEKSGFEINKKHFPEKIASIIIKKYQKVIILEKEKKPYPFPEIDVLKIWKKIIKSLEKASLIKKKGSIKKLAIYFECITNPTYPMPFFKEILNYLKSKKITLGIISNAQFYTPLLMSYFFNKLFFQNSFKDFFPKSLCFYSYKNFRAKPDSFNFLHLKKKLAKKNISAEQTLFIGNDLLKDILPASQVNFKTALFAGDKRSLNLRKGNQKIQSLKPTYVLTSLKDIYSIII